MSGASRKPDFDIWHVAFPVSNLDRAHAFYCVHLGFKIVGRDEYPSKRQLFVAIRDGGFTIELYEPKGTSVGEARHLPDHLAFECVAIEEVRSRIAGTGLAVPEIETFDNGVKCFSLRDPDGVRLDFFQGRAIYDASISAREASNTD
ncbi:MAG TPA: VOC family protein [Gemmatimonadales bacterium]|nr:VOC family protein [Gemmatimonadales bacterium]